MSVSERISREKAVAKAHVFWGRHFFASYTGCAEEKLSGEQLLDAMRNAIAASGASLISDEVHNFPNGGMTAVFLLQESHASVHTYPEHGACFVDLFTCGESTRSEEFDAVLRAFLKPTHTDVRIFLRHEKNQDSYAAVCLENDGGLRQVLYAGQTDYQRVLIADSPKYGRILVLDGELQSAESDEALYHELLVQPPMVLHPNPRRVLIIGAGEGASLREVLRHKTVESVTVVDLDAEIIE
ncbi:MAG: adenosylmethionine decarboxylase, partial [Rickettsiales bacterium]|nr:adenosylmethionine decarboxylase [Rickettsiales bacterium]